MLQQYFPIVIFIVIALLIGVVALFAGYFIRPRRPYRNKLATYECGFQPIRNARLPFDVRYYLVAILFILFDLEITFVTPWAVVFRQLRFQAIIPMAIFMALLVLGFLYEWKKGALEWD